MMELDREEQKREEFRNILFDLASHDLDKKLRSGMYRRLESLYYENREDRFHHFHADIFSVLTEVQQRDKPGNMALIGENIAILRRGYRSSNHDSLGFAIDISDSLKDLYDDVSTDIARIVCSDASDERISGSEAIMTIQSQLSQASTDIRDAQIAQQEISEQIKSQQKDFITILGIFAAIVLAFTAGLSFSSSILANIDKSSVYRLTLVALIIGLVLLNVIFAMFRYVDQLINDSPRVTLLWVPNIIIVSLIIAVVAAWHCGAVEKRNVRIEQNAWQGCSLSVDITP